MYLHRSANEKNPLSMPICFPHSPFTDIDNSGYVSDYELQELFREASLSLPGYKVREIAERILAGDTNKDEKISFEEFVVVWIKLLSIFIH